VKVIRIATRQSALALKQTEIVSGALQALFPQLKIEIIGLTTEGDRRLETSLAKIGGKGLFVKELEQALLNNEADIAVHSMKDVPFEISDSFCIAAILKREDPRDVLISNRYNYLTELPNKAVIGTSSFRRIKQLKAKKPDLQFVELRGNVPTRIKKLEDNNLDAIVLAAAGLNRLALQNRIKSYLPLEDFIPAAGQGAIGIECCKTNKAIIQLVSQLTDRLTQFCVQTERMVAKTLNASCHTPLGVYAEIFNENLVIKGFSAKIENDEYVTASVQGSKEQAELLAKQLAEKLRF